MRALFKFNPLLISLTALSVSSVASAAGLDRSGQDTTAFFQEGTYAEATYTYIDADVTGHDKSGNKIDDIAEEYDFFRYGVKTDIDDTFSIGVLYDEPWGAAADYVGDNDFVGAPTKVVDGIIASQLGQSQGVTNVAGLKGLIAGTEQSLARGKADIASAEAAIQQDPKLETVLRPKINAGKAQLSQGQAQYQQLKGLEYVLDERLADKGNTNVEVSTQSITGLLGMKLGETKNFQVYGGPVAQRLEAKVALRGNAYEKATGYDLSINPDLDYGWIAGLQYSKPEIALKASLTYRSEIEHDMKAAENFPIVALKQMNPRQTNDMKVTTPQSVNFDFQTGINPTTLATAKVRWVPWGDFAITPPLYNTVSNLNLVDYTDDQWLVELGLSKRLNPAFAVSGTLGWDSGAGNPTTSLGPVEGYYSVGAGAKFNIDKNWAISAGGKYLMFGDAKGRIPTGAIVSDFTDNDGFALGVKLSYQSE